MNLLAAQRGPEHWVQPSQPTVLNQDKASRNVLALLQA